jgi:3-oxoacyl-[acyl-carrier protein] reductase
VTLQHPKGILMNELAGKVAVVTGASKGIGAGIAKQLAAEGAAVVVNYASSKGGADEVVAAILRDGGKAIAVHADVAKRADLKRLFEATKDAFGRLDILVNNAGVFTFGALEQVTEDDFRRQFDTNVLGTILAIREALNYFGQGGGSVINLSSISSANPVPNSVVYSASKSAVDAVTKALASELAGRNIRVNVTAPGMTATEGLASMGVDESAAKSIGAGLPMGRIGKPHDIAAVAAFLASDRAAWVTGERITVSGGQR